MHFFSQAPAGCDMQCSTPDIGATLAISILIRILAAGLRSIRSCAVAVALAALGVSAALAQTDNVVIPKKNAAAITAKTEASADADIAVRISSIYGEIAALRAVGVRSSAGVVTLTGTVSTAEDKTRAEAIAARVAGVVTVQNEITRNLAVDQKLAPALGKFREDLRAIIRALPLLGVAAGIGSLIALLGYGIASLKRIWRWVTPNTFMAELVATAIRFVSIIFGLIAALEVLDATALLGGVLGGAGIVGIALGFAVRDTVNNYVSSLMLSLRQPFRANDHVVIESNEGRVVRLTSRATILMTLDGNHLRIPNATVFKAVILNYSRNPERRFEFDLGVDADDDPIEGMSVGLEAMAALPFILASPVASAVILNVGDSNIVLRFFGWVDQTKTEFMRGRSVAIQAAKAALEDAGFALPEPIYRLRFDDAAPLQVKRLSPKAAKPAAVPTPHQVSASPKRQADMAPDAHVEKLVDKERASSENDLLDSSRPVE